MQKASLISSHIPKSQSTGQGYSNQDDWKLEH